MKTIVSVEDFDSIRNRSLERARKLDRRERVEAERRISFEHPEDMASFLTGRRLGVLWARMEQPRSVTELAAALRRDRPDGQPRCEGAPAGRPHPSQQTTKPRPRPGSDRRSRREEVRVSLPIRRLTFVLCRKPQRPTPRLSPSRSLKTVGGITCRDRSRRARTRADADVMRTRRNGLRIALRTVLDASRGNLATTATKTGRPRKSLPFLFAVCFLSVLDWQLIACTAAMLKPPSLVWIVRASSTECRALAYRYI